MVTFIKIKGKAGSDDQQDKKYRFQTKSHRGDASNDNNNFCNRKHNSKEI
jgi:hypothetical protein